MNNAKTVTLAKHLGVGAKKLKEIGVFNVILGIDTKLFIDPKLLDKSSVTELNGSSEQIKQYFNTLIKINAQAGRSPRLLDQSISMIAIKEPKGLSIGYGNSRDSGTAIPETVAKRSLGSLNEMLSVGINDLTVMELLGLFTEGFGPDSISDLIASIQYQNLCQFTERISKELDVKTKRFSISGKNYNLPVHPFKDHQIIFLPTKILRPLPLATNWEEIAEAANRNTAIRKKFNDLIAGELKKFIKQIKKYPEILTKSIENINTLLQVYKEAEVLPYDTKKDSLSYERLAEYLDQISNKEAPTIQCKSGMEVVDFIEKEILPQLKRDIEQLGANRLLYHREGESIDPLHPVHEEAEQILLHITADQLCRNSNIMVSRESKTGVGSVDFSIGTGYKNKSIVEAKKSNNNDLIHGYEKQVRLYLEAEAASAAFYVVVIVKKRDFENQGSQLNQLKKIHDENIKNKVNCPKLFIINGLINPPASKNI